MLQGRLPDVLGTGGLPWHRDPLGRELGFSGAHLTTETIAALAQLYLDQGRWEGRRLLDEQWVARADDRLRPRRTVTRARSPTGAAATASRSGGSCTAAAGTAPSASSCVVLPEQDAVVAITSENEDMQATLDAVWRHLLPAMGHGGSPADDAELAERLARLEIPPLASTAPEAPPARASVTSGDLPPEWDEVRVEGTSLALRRDTMWLEVSVGDGTWVESSLTVGDLTLPVAASGGWQDPSTYRAHLLVVETPHRLEARGASRRRRHAAVAPRAAQRPGAVRERGPTDLTTGPTPVLRPPARWAAPAAR